MASRTSGRGDERSSGRNASSANGNAARRQGMAAQGSTDSARPNATEGASRNAAPSSNQNATRSATQSANQSTSRSRETQPQQREATSSASESTRRSDQERELRTAREQGNMRPSASAQRGNIGRESGGHGTSSANAGSNPFALMRRMMEDMDRLFSDFGFTTPGMFGSSALSSGFSSSPAQRSLGAGSSGASTRSAGQGGQQSLARGGQGSALRQSTFGSLWAPQVELFERGNNLVVRADLPGLSREDVDVELDDDALIIRGERHNDVEDEDEGFYRSERSYGSFYRAIPLPEGIDVSVCNATFRDGVLEVTLPKPPQQPSRSRRIDVRGS